MDIWFVSTFWLLWIIVLWIFTSNLVWMYVLIYLRYILRSRNARLCCDLILVIGLVARRRDGVDPERCALQQGRGLYILLKQEGDISFFQKGVNCFCSARGSGRPGIPWPRCPHYISSQPDPWTCYSRQWMRIHWMRMQWMRIQLYLEFCYSYI